MDVIITAYGYDGKGLSESATAYNIVQQLSGSCDLTVFTRSPVKNNHRINTIPTRFFRFGSNNALKLDYFEFITRSYFAARKAQPHLIQHISPISLRYPNPLCMINAPFIWGPVGGSIPYPQGFEHRSLTEPIIQRFRKFDSFRLRLDPSLRKTLTSSKKIIVTSNASKKLIPSRYQHKTDVIPEGISITPDADPAFCDSDFIFSSGRLVPYKAFDLLIRSFAKAPSSADFQLKITGDGPEKKHLYKLIHELGLSQHVKLLGRVSLAENKKLMREARFCVFPALNEAFGHVNLESMSQKKAVIVTRNGGPADIVEHGKTGFSILAGNEKEYIIKLSQKIDLLLQRPNLAKQMGNSGYERLCKHYTWDVIGHAYRKIYHQFKDTLPPDKN